MQATWLDATATLSRLGFHLLVAGLGAATLVRFGIRYRSTRASGENDGSPGRRIERFFFEYLANTSRDSAARSVSPPAERRRNLRGRELMDWVREQLAKRGFPVQKEREFLQDVRKVVRDETWLTADEAVGAGSEDGPAEVPPSAETWGRKE